jgi:hypothetical protein
MIYSPVQVMSPQGVERLKVLFGELASDEHWFVHQHCSGRLPAMTTPYSFAIEEI